MLALCSVLKSEAQFHSLYFDGVDDHVELNETILDQHFSFEGWIRFAADGIPFGSDAGSHIVSIGADNDGTNWASFAVGVSLSIEGMPQLTCEFGQAYQYGANEAFPMGEWVHFAVVFDAGALHVYQNGLNVLSTQTPFSSPSGGGNNYFIGARGDDWEAGAYSFHGEIAQISQWQVALSSSEIQALVGCSQTAQEEGLLSLWTFETGEGDVLVDQVGVNSGQIEGAIWSDLMPLFYGCTDSAACNFDVCSNIHDESCLYPPVIDLGDDIETCEDLVTLDAGEGFGSYRWSTGETSQTITVSESGLYEATVSSHPANTWSLSFDGDGDWVSIAPIQSDVLEVGGAASIEITYAGYGALFSGAPTSGPAFPMIFRTEINDLGNGIAEYKTYHRSASLDVNEEPVSDVFPYNGVDWNTVLVSIDNMNGKYTLYHNGQMFLDYEFEPASFSSSGLDWGIGNLVYNGGGTNTFSGFIDHVAVYDEYLTEADANGLFGCSLSLDPIHEWDFEEGQGEVAIDATVNENHGQLIGATWSDQTSSNSNCESCEASDEILVVMPNCDGYCGEGTVWDPFNQECIVAIPTDTDFDGCVAAGDLLNLLGTFGSCPPIPFSGPCQGQDHVTYQGYDYDIVAIGEQCWFAENLLAESYRNGDEIESGISDADWSSLSGATSVYGEGTSDCESFAPDGDACIEDWPLVQYGRLYNWYAVDDERGLCPFGWHVPSLSHWTELTVHLDSLGDAGFLMKTSTGWSNNGGGGNDSGFSGLPTGYRNWDGSFQNAGKRGYWWSCTPHPSESNAWAYYLRLVESQNHVDHFHDEVDLGFAIRCVKD